MDGTPSSILPDGLYAHLGTASAPVVVDVRRRQDFDADDCVIVGAIRCDLDDERQWLRSLPTGRPIVVYCAEGRDVSRAAAATLRGADFNAAYLEGGIAGWRNCRLPTRRKSHTQARKWVTRERPKIDRIACPWLIRRFIDPGAEFLYVPAGDVRSVAGKTGAMPFDIEGVEFAHEGDRCSFDTLLRIYAIEDAALDRLATIVRRRHVAP
jgi:rhodanese-related sulfurtransferase